MKGSLSSLTSGRQSRYETTWVRSDLGTKWPGYDVLGTKWPTPIYMRMIGCIYGRVLNTVAFWYKVLIFWVFFLLFDLLCWYSKYSYYCAKTRTRTKPNIPMSRGIQSLTTKLYYDKGFLPPLSHTLRTTVEGHFLGSKQSLQSERVPILAMI